MATVFEETKGLRPRHRAIVRCTVPPVEVVRDSLSAPAGYYYSPEPDVSVTLVLGKTEDPSEHPNFLRPGTWYVDLEGVDCSNKLDFAFSGYHIHRERAFPTEDRARAEFEYLRWCLETIPEQDLVQFVLDGVAGRYI